MVKLTRGMRTVLDKGPVYALANGSDSLARRRGTGLNRFPHVRSCGPRGETF